VIRRRQVKRALEAYAKQNQIQVPPGFRQRPDTFGVPARELTRRVQRHARLHVDGLVGPATLMVIGRFLPGPLAFRAAICMEVVQGPLETGGNNMGPWVQEIQRLGSQLNPGSWPWCAAATSWAYRAAGWEQWADFVRNEHEAWVPAWVSSARAGRYGMSVVSVGAARRGDAICFDWSRGGLGDGVHDHIGLLRSRPKVLTGSVLTVEGNTSSGQSGSQADGDGLWARVRNARHPAVLVRIKE